MKYYEKLMHFFINEGKNRLFLLSLGMTIILHIIIMIIMNSTKHVDYSGSFSRIFKLVDIQSEAEKEEIMKMKMQEKVTENIIETKKRIEEDIEYVPQHKLSKPPILPFAKIRSKIFYPALARKKGIEGVVFLLLYIDKIGNIRNIEVLKDPGFGFKEAAINALKGIKCTPAQINGIPIATKYRYPIRFSLN